MGLYFIIGILVILLTGFLFSPLVLQVDTSKNHYAVRWGIGSLQFIPTPDDLLLSIGIGFWRHHFSLLNLLAKPSKKEQNSISKTKKKGQPRKPWPFQRLLRVIRTFHIRQFRLDMDTDDFVTNAYLYPVFRALSAPTRVLTINFQGRNQCAFEVKNRVINVLVALIF
ncbi:hypothetical protein Halhy_1957 [Haliscomenobacter hydrossis DSM 1100]|uniref:DUF2953 domain-containing protein n=1 Tax=Haliscomenobacter hydrossis (strain ATCC 27775 / DSM 1100 / LMG 10767 / O) TaxID=760192 RepID=F4L6J9_HALH1|nr:hypothetical protein Halhy_1957 [Haliscomenobacter hydrossis DSM 1100]